MKTFDEKQHDVSMGVLRQLCYQGNTVYTLLRHGSVSGMSKEISLFAVAGGKLIDLTYNASVVLGRKIGKHGGIVMRGTGYNAAYELVHDMYGVVNPDVGTYFHQEAI